MRVTGETLSTNAGIAFENSTVTESDRKSDSNPEKLVEELDVEYDDDYTEKLSRERRSDDKPEKWAKVLPGACVKGCAMGFYAFSIISSIINCFGASGRIGNLLG